MPTRREQVEELTKLKHRLTVWQAIYRLVDERFISKDGRKVGGIKVQGCADELVPEETIESVLQEIGEGPIALLSANIESIENQQVVVVGEAKASA